MRIIEKTLVIFALIGYIFLLLFWKGGGPITAVSLLALGGLYFFFSFALLNGIKLRAIFRNSSYDGLKPIHIVGAILAGFVFFQACFSLIFATLLWTGYKPILVISIIVGLVALIICVIPRPTQRVYYNRILTRLVPLLCFCIFLFLYSPRLLTLKILYHNHPALIEAQERSWDDPSNRELRSKAIEEWQKVNHQ